jgi:hypothetical protein
MLKTQFIDRGQDISLLDFTCLDAFNDGIGQLPVFWRGGKLVNMNQ